MLEPILVILVHELWSNFGESFYSSHVLAMWSNQKSERLNGLEPFFWGDENGLLKSCTVRQTHSQIYDAQGQARPVIDGTRPRQTGTGIQTQLYSLRPPGQTGNLSAQKTESD